MLNVNFTVPKFIGVGASGVSGYVNRMVAAGMRGGVMFARASSQNWHKMPISGTKHVGGQINADIEIKWAEFASHMEGVIQRVRNVVPFLEKVGVFLEGRIKDRIRSTLRNTPRGGRHGGGISTTGRLASDWSHILESSGPDEGILRVGTRVKYARIHEFGGTIRPVRATALTVPFPGNVGAYPPARELWHSGLTFIKNNVIYLRDRSGNKNIKPIPIYILKKSVNMPARPYVAWVLTVYGPKIRDMAQGHMVQAISTPGVSRIM